MSRWTCLGVIHKPFLRGIWAPGAGAAVEKNEVDPYSGKVGENVLLFLFSNGGEWPTMWPKIRQETLKLLQYGQEDLAHCHHHEMMRKLLEEIDNFQEEDMTTLNSCYLLSLTRGMQKVIYDLQLTPERSSFQNLGAPECKVLLYQMCCTSWSCGTWSLIHRPTVSLLSFSQLDYLFESSYLWLTRYMQKMQLWTLILIWKQPQKYTAMYALGRSWESTSADHVLVRIGAAGTNHHQSGSWGTHDMTVRQSKCLQTLALFVGKIPDCHSPTFYVQWYFKYGSFFGLHLLFPK